MTINNLTSFGFYPFQDESSISAAPAASIGKTPPPSLWWADTAPPPPPTWLIDELILMGATNNLAGEPGVGKTRLVAHIAAHIASGTPFLNREVLKGSVLYLNFDDNEALPRLWTERAVNGIGKDFLTLKIAYWKPSAGVEKSKGLNDPDVLLDIQQLLETIKVRTGEYPKLIIIDTFQAALPTTDNNNANAIIGAYAVIDKLIERADGAAVIILDHTPKAITNEGFNRGISGSHQKKARARTQSRLLKVQDLAGEDSDVITWAMDKNNAGPMLKPFKIRRELSADAKSDQLFLLDSPYSNTKVKEAIAYDYLKVQVQKANGTSIGRMDLRNRANSELKIGFRTIDNALTALREDSDIKVTEIKGAGNPIMFSWAVPVEPTQSSTPISAAPATLIETPTETQKLAIDAVEDDIFDILF